MVGVPRSKACLTCRARRKGCDARQPSCSQCTHRGVRCLGYARDLKFVSVQPATQDDTSSDRSSSGPSTASVDRNGLMNPALIELLPSLHSTAFRSQTYDRFVTDYAPHSVETWPSLPTDLAVLPSTSWLTAAVAVAATDPVLNDALTALALAQVGRTTKHPDLLVGSTKLYTQALSGLNRRLKDGDHCLTDTTLAAASALSIYEMQEGSVESRSKSWASHVKGASALIHLRGRANFSTPLSNRVFLGIQIAEFIAAVGQRKRAANASLWSQTYQDFMPDSDFVAPMRLFEALHDLPEIMKEAESIEACAPEVGQSYDNMNDALSSLIQRCQDFEMRLTAWYNDMESRYWRNHEHNRASSQSSSPEDVFGETPPLHPELYWFEPSTLYSKLPEDSPRRIFPSYICFVDPDIGYQIVMHWTGILLMHTTLQLALARLRPFNTSELSTASGIRFETLYDTHSLALLIAQSLEFFVHPDMGLMGTNIIGFPLSVAQRFFHHSGAKETSWFEVILERISEMKSGLSGFLDDMAKRRTVKLASPYHRND